MNLYLAGTYSRPYVFEQWKSISLEKTGKPASLQNYLMGGGYEYLSCRRNLWKPSTDMDKNSKWGGYNKHLFGWRASSEKRQIGTRGGGNLYWKVFTMLAITRLFKNLSRKWGAFSLIVELSPLCRERPQLIGINI